MTPARVTLAFAGLTSLLAVAVAAPAHPSPVRHAIRPATDPPPAALVRIPFPQDDGNLTPYEFQLGYPLMMLVYDSLLWRDASGTPKPWLARSMEESTDHRRITLRLSPGVRFHDGAALTSDDVVFTFRWFTDHPQLRFTGELGAVSSVRAPDASTVVIELSRPSPGFADQPLADLPILPAHLWRDLPPGRRAPDGLPVGSGPYRLTRHDAGKSYHFEANAEYFRGRPSVQTIEVPIVNDADSTLRALEERRVDMIPLSLPPSAADQVKSLGVKAITGVSYVGISLTFNLRRSPFDSLEARRVVSDAIDLQRVSDGVRGTVPATRGVLHPASPWAPAASMHSTDVAAARDAARRLELPALAVMAPDNEPVTTEVARQVVLALQRAGMAAQLQTVSRDQLSTALGEDGSTPDFDLAVSSFSPLGSFDPDFLRRLFGGDSGALDPSGYHSATFDQLADRVAGTSDFEARRTAVGAEVRQLATDLPVLPLLFPVGRYTYRPAIYDRWVYVKGSGILDKQSFLAPTSGAAPSAATTVPVIEALDNSASKGSGTSFLRWAALGLGAFAVAMAVAGGLRWWRARTRTDWS